MNTEILDQFARMVGGNEECFFREYWRQKTLLVEGALPQFMNLYDCPRFIEDYRRVNWHQATLVITIDGQGNRRMGPPKAQSSVDEALNQGRSVVLQVLLLPENLANRPAIWGKFATLYRDLCDYLLPSFPSGTRLGGPVAALDIFCTSAESTSGGHYDTGDVFYFVLEGEKEWTVELAADLEMGIRLASEGSKVDLEPRKEYMKVTVKPGDCLYVPPYTYHRVRSHGRSLAVSFGLPTFTELTLIRSCAIRMQTERHDYQPLPSFPKTQGALFEAAEEEIQSRTLQALGLKEHPAQSY
jgi:ribosomal protein L16 Arg81 hydroxylase